MTGKQVIDTLKAKDELTTDEAIELVRGIIKDHVIITKDLDKLDQENLEASVGTDSLKFLKNLVKFISAVADITNIFIDEHELLNDLIKDYNNAEVVSNYRPFNYNKKYL